MLHFPAQQAAEELAYFLNLLCCFSSASVVLYFVHAARETAGLAACAASR
jgi:hypothetical protein